ncbi:protein fem-1 homolog B, partial [Eurytemora carolleeae]|uniref:protein fem-1 homolog B n=1 Tax=Eurytemora carolleeae TaxID=1294199 RepID=UPI000C762FC1
NDCIGATALWCAAGAGHLEIVSLLLLQGARIDHETKTKSTPLRAACFEGRLDIVSFLCEQGADIERGNKYDNTCLMISCYKGHREVVEYLLAQGADPNSKALCGASACHFAAETGNIYIVEALLNNGARMDENKHGMTPLLCAAERCQAMMVEYLIERPEVSKEMAVTAMELLGASFANDNDNYDIGTSYSYLHRAMKLRWEDPIIQKSNLVQTPAYDNRLESRTVEELESIAENPDSIHMEGLCIRERVLGKENPELPYIIIFRGAIFADSSRFDRCTLLWLHALSLRLGTKTSVSKDLLRFAQMFSQMYKSGHGLNLDQVTSVLASTVQEISWNIEKISLTEKEEKESMEDELEQNMLTALYLIIIIVKKIEKSSVPESAMKEVYKLVHLNPITSTGCSLLHLSVNQQTAVDDFHTNEVCKFPCIATTKILLQAGADPQAMDSQRNTPLHIIVSYTRIVADFITLHTIIISLLEAGAHIDCVNSLGQTPLDAATSGVAEIILKSQTKMSLKCLAAKSVRKYNLTYQGQVPQCLESFIQIHGP